MEGSSSQKRGEPPFIDSALLKKSPRGSYYVEDEEGGRYEIEAFLGDIRPLSQVFRAQHTKIVDGRVHQEIVALKLARVDGSDEFSNMRQEAESSLRISSNDGQENDVISANNVVIGIYKSFIYRGFFCVSMPYMKRGSLRYITNSRMVCWKLPHEMSVAVVLRETLEGLCFLHARGEVHGKLHAGNIYVPDVEGQMAIKLGYKGSTYYHNPDHDNNTIPKIWDERFHGELRNVYLYVSMLPENEFWTIDRPYEPSSDQQNYTFAADIWNFGVTALELALGSLRTYIGRMRSPDELRTFLTNLQQNQENSLPILHELFIGDLPTPQWNRLSSSFIAMVKRCLVLDPNQRPTAQMLLHDPFFAEHHDVDLRFFSDVIRAYDWSRGYGTRN